MERPSFAPQEEQIKNVKKHVPKPGSLSDETHTAWKGRATAAEMAAVNKAAEEATRKLQNKQKKERDALMADFKVENSPVSRKTEEAWEDNSILENYADINQPHIEVMEPVSEQEMESRDIVERMKNLEDEMDAIEDPFSDAFLMLATEYNKLDQKLEHIKRQQTKEQAPETMEETPNDVGGFSSEPEVDQMPEPVPVNHSRPHTYQPPKKGFLKKMADTFFGTPPNSLS